MTAVDTQGSTQTSTRLQVAAFMQLTVMELLCCGLPPSSHSPPPCCCWLSCCCCHFWLAELLSLLLLSLLLLSQGSGHPTLHCHGNGGELGHCRLTTTQAGRAQRQTAARLEAVAVMQLTVIELLPPSSYRRPPCAALLQLHVPGSRMGPGGMLHHLGER